jgi:hypothetical protein
MPGEAPALNSLMVDLSSPAAACGAQRNLARCFRLRPCGRRATEKRDEVASRFVAVFLLV